MGKNSPSKPNHPEWTKAHWTTFEYTHSQAGNATKLLCSMFSVLFEVLIRASPSEPNQRQ